MSLQASTTTDGAIEECLDEINDFVATLDRYPPATVAVAMSVHLQTMLCALVDCDLCTTEQVKDFVHELERDVCAEIEVGKREGFYRDRTRAKPSV
jgi:hypothetical protein